MGRNNNASGWNGLYRPEHDVKKLRFQSIHEFHRYGLFRVMRRRPEHDVKLFPENIAIGPTVLSGIPRYFIDYGLSAVDRLLRLSTDHQHAGASNFGKIVSVVSLTGAAVDRRANVDVPMPQVAGALFTPAVCTSQAGTV